MKESYLWHISDLKWKNPWSVIDCRQLEEILKGQHRKIYFSLFYPGKFPWALRSSTGYYFLRLKTYLVWGHYSGVIPCTLRRVLWHFLALVRKMVVLITH